MFKFLGKIFGSDKAMNTMVQGAVKGLDALVYTGEEQAQDKAKAITEARAMVVRWMEATQGQNLARRLIALVITGVWVFQYVIATVMSVVAVWVTNPISTQRLIDSSAVINNSAQQMNGAVMLILAFYFAAPHMGDIAKVAMQKFGGGK